MTHRQFLAWEAWYDLDMERPSKDNWYAMQIALEVRRVLHSNPNSVTLDGMRLKFTQKNAETTEEHKRNQLELAKRMWVGRVGGKVRTANGT